jgi:hypothetical protein
MLDRSEPHMQLPDLPLWLWPALALAAALFCLYRQRRWPFDGPAKPPPADPWRDLQMEIIRGILAKQGLLPPVDKPTAPKVIEMPRRFVIVPMDEDDQPVSD